MVWTKEEFSAKVRDGQQIKHPWKNAFHLEMPFGLINDPNGLSFYQGKYQIFYQWNPYGCEHKQKHWGHVATSDFIHYTEPVLAMKPDCWFDKDGCYTGCAFTENEELHVVYTGNVRTETMERQSYQCLAKAEADGTLSKEKILIEQQPAGYTAHFRDPYVFFRGNKKYLLAGIQTENLAGRLVLYRETAGKWELVGEIATDFNAMGYMWECPNILRFGDEDVIVFSPQGLKAERYQYQNLYQTGYAIGTLDTEKAVFSHGKFTELDHGFDFYAPQVMEHEGRKLLLGWMGMPERDAEYPTRENGGWMFSLTIPRELVLKNDKIYQYPAVELEKLRQKEQSSVAKGAHSWEQVLPRQAEIELRICLGKAKKIAYAFYFGAERLVFIYDDTEKSMVINRTGMKLGGRGIRRFKLGCKGELHVRIFMDRTAMECFFQQGEEAAAILYFPEKECVPEFSVQADEDWNQLTCKCWELGRIVYEESGSV